MTEADGSNEVVIPPQGRVPAEVEAELWKLADQVESILRLAGLPAHVAKDGAPFGGVDIVVDASQDGAGVFVGWVVSDALHEASLEARRRMNPQDPANVWFTDLIAEVMPDALVRVLRTAGLRVTEHDVNIQVEGPVPDYLLELIER